MLATRRFVVAFTLVIGIAMAVTSVSAAPAHRVRGTIASVSADTIVVTGQDGKPVTVKTNPGTRIIGQTPGRFEDIKNGDLVRVVANKAQDGSLTAFAVRDVPSGLQIGTRGRGGQKELPSGKVLVSGSVVSIRGNMLSVTSTDAVVTTVTVPQGAQIQRVTQVPLGSLAPGVRVALQGTDNPDGTVTAVFIMVGGNGQR
jgi:Domain of unknown function (DUF5666)